MSILILPIVTTFVLSTISKISSEVNSSSQKKRKEIVFIQMPFLADIVTQLVETK